MRYFIGIEELAANAMIAMLKNNQNNCFIPYSKMNEYGLQVIRNLENEGDCGIFVFSRDNVTAMLNDCSDFFLEKEEKGQLGLCLMEGKSLDDLINRFMACLPLKLIYAFAKANKMFAAA